MELNAAGLLASSAKEGVGSLFSRHTESGGETRSNKKNSPARRVVLFTLCIACLSFLVIVINSLFTFLMKLSENEKFLNYIKEFQFQALKNASFVNKTNV